MIMLAYRPSHLIVVKDLAILLMGAVLLVSSTDQRVLHLQMSSCDRTVHISTTQCTFPVVGQPCFRVRSQATWQMGVHFDLIGGICSGETDLTRRSARLLNSLAVSLYNPSPHARCLAVIT